MNVVLGDPFVNLMVEKKVPQKSVFSKTDPLAFTTVIGLALRGVNNK
jgi:Tfp pilus assembly PilM family ATPase